jgi:hypothetical protein
MFWLSGLFWLEAARRRRGRLWYGFVAGACMGSAAASHWFGLPALSAVLVYQLAARLDQDPATGRRSLITLSGVVVVLVPLLLALRPYSLEVWTLLSSQGGGLPPSGPIAAWARHRADLWFLIEWMKVHLGNVWAATALLTVPNVLAVSPIVIAVPILFALPWTRVFGLAAMGLPTAVVLVDHKSIGYEMPEIALYLLACGWLLASVLDRLVGPTARIAASLVFVLPIATASPAIWDPRSLRLLDQSHSLDLLRAMGRSVVGPGAAVVGRFYTDGADKWLAERIPEHPSIGFTATRESDFHSLPLHRSYWSGRTRAVGFVLTPEMPSASLVYFKAGQDARWSAGFLARDGKVSKFSESLSGWRFSMLGCRARAEELSWVWPQPPVPISGYVPRTSHCVARLAKTAGTDPGASVFLRRTASIRDVSSKVLVALLLPEASREAIADTIDSECACTSLQEVSGGLSDVPASWLLGGLKKTDVVIRFYASGSDLAANRPMTAGVDEGSGPDPTR